jgi:4-carboxymuconolactone decarboxylase
MPRLPEITVKDALPDDKHPIFDAIAASRGRVGYPFSLLLNSPEVAGRVAHLGTYLRFESALPAPDRELAIITAAREFDCAFEWSAHVRGAERAGVRQEAISAVANDGDLDALTADEALVVRYGRELFRKHRVSDETFESARARFGDQGITELTGLMGYYALLACCLNAFEVQPGPDAVPLPQRPSAYAMDRKE